MGLVYFLKQTSLLRVRKKMTRNENEQLDNMSDDDWEQELNDEEDFDDEKVFE